MTRVELCNLGDIPAGGGVRITSGVPRPLAVWRAGDQVYVTDDTCTHGKASLVDEGEVEGFAIECGLHQGSFDMRTGAVLSAPCRIPLKTYEALVEGGVVAVDIE